MQIVIKCALCPNSRKMYASRLKHGRGKYCSKPCRLKALSSYCILNNPTIGSRAHFGEENGNWQNGVSYIKERKYFQTKRRLARKRANGSHTYEEWLAVKAYYDNTCLCCKRQEPEVHLSEDHVIPISRNGSDNISNIQPLCISCNSRKSVSSTDYRIETEYTLNDVMIN